jgi:hypothetical protein
VGLVDLGEHRLRDLDGPLHVFQIGEGSFPPLRSLSAFPRNLRIQLTSYVGRQGELALVAKALWGITAGHVDRHRPGGKGPSWQFRWRRTWLRVS